MKMIQFLTMLLLLTNTGIVSAIEIENVTLPDSVKIEKTGELLVLNGAGIRKKLFFDIYICGLYLENKNKNPEDILQSKGEKQVFMHFLYDEVSKEKLVAGWTDGFEENHSEKQMVKLKERLANFNAMFITVKKGNTIRLDFHADGTLAVLINGEAKGKVNGHDFQQALLRIWIGDEPVTDGLKTAMLGLSNN